MSSSPRPADRPARSKGCRRTSRQHFGFSASNRTYGVRISAEKTKCLREIRSMANAACRGASSPRPVRLPPRRASGPRSPGPPRPHYTGGDLSKGGVESLRRYCAGPPATRSPHHPATRSPHHPATRSPHHPATRSPHHPFTPPRHRVQASGLRRPSRIIGSRRSAWSRVKVALMHIAEMSCIRSAPSMSVRATPAFWARSRTRLQA